MWLLFKGGYYLRGATIRGGYYLRAAFLFMKAHNIVRVIQWRQLVTVSSKRSLSVLLWAVETNCTTQTALAQWPSSEIICTCEYVPCVVAAAIIWGQHLFHSRVPDCAATYSRATSIWRNTVLTNALAAQIGGLDLIPKGLPTLTFCMSYTHLVFITCRNWYS